jgi:Fe-S cluster assembly iron-binding protein IscA
MFEVSEKAQEEIKKVLAERGENAPIRVLLSEGG